MAKSTKGFSAKDRIEHSVYGTGTIADVTDRYTMIDFDEHGSKKFLTSMVKLSPSDTEAPAKVRRKKTTKKKVAKKTTTKKTAKKTTKKKVSKKKAAEKDAGDEEE